MQSKEQFEKGDSLHDIFTTISGNGYWKKKQVGKNFQKKFILV